MPEAKDWEDTVIARKVNWVAFNQANLEKLLSEQAEISFKAGQAFDIELIRDTYNKAYEKGKKVGKKEVVEFLVSHKRSYYAKPDGTIISVTSAEWTEQEWESLTKGDGL